MVGAPKALTVARTASTATASVFFILLSLLLLSKPAYGFVDVSRNASNATTTSASGNGTRPLPSVSQELLVNTTQFYLDPNWNVSAAPTTRVHHWTLSEVTASPGGLAKPMITINYQSPGPLVEANLGDTLVVHVYNDMTNATTIHWHGQYQNGTNFYDGTSGITQCGIPPKTLFTYNFTIQNVGTYWYHAHQSTQYADGLYGAMVLHSPTEPARTTVPYDREVVLLVGDLYNTYSQELLARYMSPVGIDGTPGDEPTPDGGFINGFSQAQCAYIPASNSTATGNSTTNANSTDAVIPESRICAPASTPLKYSELTLERNQTYRFRIINAATFLSSTVSIDGHILTVVEADGTSVEPRPVESITVGVAQRYSAIVTLNQTSQPYWIRSTVGSQHAAYKNPVLNSTTFAVLRYSDGNSTALPANTSAPAIPGNIPSTLDYTKDLVPVQAIPPYTPDLRITTTFSMGYDPSNVFRAFFNSTSWSRLENTTTLNMASASRLPMADAHPVNQTVSTNQLVASTSGTPFIEFVVNSLDSGQHPFHLHGHTFQILGTGPGTYNGQNLDTANNTNPMRRDTIIINGNNWMVLRWHADNPGLWAFHCHIQWHMEKGMLMQFEERSDVIGKGLKVPQAVSQLCNAQ